MALDMRALYYVALPTERSEADDVQRHEEDIKANENCLNQNFYALAQKYMSSKHGSHCLRLLPHPMRAKPTPTLKAAVFKRYLHVLTGQFPT